MRVNLEMEGYAVREAGSAEEGLKVLDELRPDLVLLDVMMPKVDGWEMLQLMQERHGVGSIPVVMFSGKVDEATADEAAERGAQGFIGKPFDPQQLIDADQAAAADLIWLDHHLERWIVHHRVGWLNPLVVDFTRIATDGLLFVIIGAVLALVWRRPWFLRPAAWRPTSRPTGSRSSCGSGSAACARRSSTRSRGRSCRTPHTGSFPSGHAATAFACATVIAWASPRLAVPAFVLAALVAWSRVYVGVHWPLDVLGGAALGVLVATALLKLARGRPRLRPGRQQADPDADPAAGGRRNRVGDRDQADQDEDRRERAERDHDEALGHRRRQLEAELAQRRPARAARARSKKTSLPERARVPGDHRDRRAGGVRARRTSR